MSFDNWLKEGTLLPDGERAESLYVRGNEWQLYTTGAGGYALLVTADLYGRWMARDLLEEGPFLIYSGVLSRRRRLP